MAILIFELKNMFDNQLDKKVSREAHPFDLY
jgi:hypothetical protein